MIWVYPWIGNLRMFRSATRHHIWICTPIQRTQNDKSTTILQQENTQKNMVQRLVFLGGSFGVPEKFGSAPWCTCDTCASLLQQFPPLVEWRRWRVHRLHLTHGRWLLWWDETGVTTLQIPRTGWWYTYPYMKNMKVSWDDFSQCMEKWNSCSKPPTRENVIYAAAIWVSGCQTQCFVPGTQREVTPHGSSWHGLWSVITRRSRVQLKMNRGGSSEKSLCWTRACLSPCWSKSNSS